MKIGAFLEQNATRYDAKLDLGRKERRYKIGVCFVSECADSLVGWTVVSKSVDGAVLCTKTNSCCV